MRHHPTKNGPRAIETARARYPIVIGHRTVLSIFVAWLALLVTAFLLGTALTF